jgi:hypothetical protein
VAGKGRHGRDLALIQDGCPFLIRPNIEGAFVANAFRIFVYVRDHTPTCGRRANTVINRDHRMTIESISERAGHEAALHAVAVMIRELLDKAEREIVLPDDRDVCAEILELVTE